MSVIGIDLGNDTAILAQAKRGGVDVLLNENSTRLNHVLVSFNGKERFIGEGAVTQARSNFKNTVAQVKRFLGRKFSEPDVQFELERHVAFPEQVVQLDNDEIGFKVMYNDAETVLTPQQILGMFFTKMRNLVESASGSRTADVVVSVPSYFTDSQRHAMLDACAIGGVKCLRLLNDTTAAALAYGMYRSAKGEFDAKEETKVMFVSMGHSTFSAAVVGYVQGKLRILASTSERNAGGRDIDQAVARHLAEEFKTRTGCDAWANIKARIKLLGAAEKAKQVLSPHGVTETPIHLECLMNDQDFSTRITLETLESLAEPLLARLAAPLLQVLEQAGVAISDLASVEMMGGGMRPRCVKRTVAAVLDLPGKDDPTINNGLMSTMNMDECIARGCAFACAMLSPLFRVKEVAVEDSVPYPIRVSWDLKRGDAAAAAAADAADAGSGSGAGAGAGADATGDSESKTSDNSLVLFAFGASTPGTKRITFKTAEPFTVSAAYDAEATQRGLPESTPRDLLAFRVEGVPEDVAAAAAVNPDSVPNVRVDFKHDINGMFSVEKAVLMKEIVEDEEDAADGKAGEAAPAAAAADGDATPKAAEGETPKAAEGETPKAADGKAGDEAAKKKKKKYKRVALKVNTSSHMGMSQAAIAKALELEADMQVRDQVIRETQNKRNELEAYIYDMRDALIGRLAEFATESDKATLTSLLTEAEDWLYGDGFDTTKQVYTAKLEQLQQLGNPITTRSYEAEHRQAALTALEHALEYFKQIITTTDPLYEHLTDEDRDALRTACKETEAWTADRLAAQSALPGTADPVLTVKDIRQEEQKLRNNCNPIATKPKPPPPAPAAAPAPAPAPAPAADEPAADDAGAAGDGAGAGAGGDAADAAPAPVDKDGDVVADDDAPAAGGADAPTTESKDAAGDIAMD